MNLLELLEEVKPICKIDLDEEDFDHLLKQFINDTIIDLYEDLKTPDKNIYPIVNGEVELDKGLNVVKVSPPLLVGDQTIGNKIFTKHVGVLEIWTIEEAPRLVDNTDTLDLPSNILSVIKYKVASLWYGFKKKVELSQYWNMFYMVEKQKKLKSMEIEETYEMGLPFSNFFN